MANAKDSQSVMSKSEVWHRVKPLVILLLRFANVDFLFFVSDDNRGALFPVNLITPTR